MRNEITIQQIPILQNRMHNPAWLRAREKAPEGVNKYVLHKDQISIINRYNMWLMETNRPWCDIDLDGYVEELSKRLAPASVAVHIATIRKRYTDILSDNDFMNEVDIMSVHKVRESGMEVNPANVRATSMIFLDRMRNNIASGKGVVRGIVKKQDRVDSALTWLTTEEVNQYLLQIDRDKYIGLRDSALISLALCTGLRANELANLRIGDLYEKKDDLDVVLVRAGKGNKMRVVPYGEMKWCLDVVEDWIEVRNLKAMGGGFDVSIYEELVFTGITPKGDTVLDSGKPLTNITIERRVAKYGKAIGLKVTPHDLRRSYARNLFLSGVEMYRIQLNMGHSDNRTTVGYVGDLDTAERAPGMVYENPFR